MTDKIKLTDRRVSLSNRYIETLKKKNKILEIPDYIKIDVDGIEYLILEGGDRYLKNKSIIPKYEIPRQDHSDIMDMM